MTSPIAQEGTTNLDHWHIIGDASWSGGFGLEWFVYILITVRLCAHHAYRSLRLSHFYNCSGSWPWWMSVHARRCQHPPPDRAAGVVVRRLLKNRRVPIEIFPQSIGRTLGNDHSVRSTLGIVPPGHKDDHPLLSIGNFLGHNTAKAKQERQEAEDGAVHERRRG